MCDKKILEKVKRLFALSENNPSQEEAQSALLMARKLLQEHGLTMMDIDVHTEKEYNRLGCDDVQLDDKQCLPSWVIALGGILGLYFDIGCAFTNKRNWHNISFYGAKVNVKAASSIFPGLVNQIENLAKNYKTWEMHKFKDRGHTRKLRESYILGLIKGFHERLQLEKLKEEEEETTTALAVYNEDLKKEWEKRAGWKLKEPKVKSKIVEKDAFTDGIRDSSKLQLTKGLTT